ncbi:MAG: hypothetical protein ACOVQX_06200 [Legionella sp.]
MTYPKLSATLNNCGLHALTPELKLEILKFSKDAIYSNKFVADYLLLKNQFAQYYGFDEKKFTWVDFGLILSCYNAFDTQLILGPVLRKFMAVKIGQDTDLVSFYPERDPNETISELTAIDASTHRYANLGPDQIMAYVGKHLGFNIIAHLESNIISGDTTSSTTDYIATIDIYHSGTNDAGHWERSDDLNQIIDQSSQSLFKSAINLLREYPKVHEVVLNHIKKHIKITASVINDYNLYTNEYIQINLTIEQIHKLLWNSFYVNQHMAKLLLGNQLTNDALAFHKSAQYESSVPSNFDKQLKLFMENPQLHPIKNADDKATALKLLTPVDNNRVDYSLTLSTCATVIFASSMIFLAMTALLLLYIHLAKTMLLSLTMIALVSSLSIATTYFSVYLYGVSKALREQERRQMLITTLTEDPQATVIMNQENSIVPNY